MVAKRILLGLFSIFSSIQAFAWGSHGHEMIASVGSTIATGTGSEFWQANSAGMKQLATVPDRVWKSSTTKPKENSNHWFQIDSYYSDFSVQTIMSFPQVYKSAVFQYGEATVIKNGTAPWRIVQLYNLAVSAIKSGDMKSALQYAGTMSHYIGDLSQPLHVSENFDGQMTSNNGIHSWFETTNIGDEATIQPGVQNEALALLKDPNFVKQSSGPLMTTIFNEIARSIAKRDEVLKNDTMLGRTSDQAKQVQLQLAIDRMADGAATLSLVLNQLWAEAGQTTVASPVPVTDPAWIPNDYQNRSGAVDGEDDCVLQ